MQERIIGIGSSLPLTPMTNEELLGYCNLTDETWTQEKCLKWIDDRLGIRTRHCSRCRTDSTKNFFAEEGCKNSELCADAIRKAAENAKIEISELDMIIVATATPDYPIPGTSTLVQELLNVPECAVLDVRSACCGALTAVITAIQYIRSGTFRTITVVGSDVGSIFGNLDKDSPNYTREDFVNAVMIGDGAGAIILRGFTEKEEKYGIEILSFGLNSIGVGKKPGMWLPLGGSVYPGSVENASKGLQYFKHDYKAVMEHGPGLFFRALKDVMEKNNLQVSDIRLFVPHQANGLVAKEASKYMGVPLENIFFNFDTVGNTANASCMIALDQIATENKLAEGDLVLVGSAESTKWLYATILLKWSALKGPKSYAAQKKTSIWRRIYSSTLFNLVSSILSFKELPRSRKLTYLGLLASFSAIQYFAMRKYLLK